MNLLLISSLLGGAAVVLQVVTCEEVLKVRVIVWPNGSTIYLGESVLLWCSVKSNSSIDLSYSWSRAKTQTTQMLNPRHLVSSDSYSITAVTKEDEDSYWCQVESKGNNTIKVRSKPVKLSVAELPPATLALTPRTRQLLKGEHFKLYCPESKNTSLGLRLKNLPQGERMKTNDFPTGMCGKTEGCVFTASKKRSGLYWCVGAEGRSNAVNITVSYGNIIMKTPVLPVQEGGQVVLSCQFSIDKETDKEINIRNTSFFKNGAETGTYSSFTSETATSMTIDYVTQADEGFYKCASTDREMQSPESWLAVRRYQGNSTSTDETAASTQGSWIWIIVTCVIAFLFFTVLAAWLVCHYRNQMFSTNSCWPLSKEDLPAVQPPATNPHVTEVQWDLSWLEMSNLLDKSLNSGTEFFSPTAQKKY